MRRLLLLGYFLLGAALLGAAYPVYFKEQYLKLYHQHYIQAPDDSIENIYWLEQAKKADFCNPLYAMARIDDKKQWERYRALLDMEIDLKLIEQHLALGSKFDKRVAYFFNAPWKDENLDSLKTAESAYRAARDALNGWDPTGGAIYYYNPRTATNWWIRSRPVVTTIGKHVFCK